jgi:hypothetical protein
MKTWGKERTVRAAVLRHLLTADEWPVDAKGVRLRGVRISGLLDLKAATLRCPLSLDGCYLDASEPACLDHATALQVTLSGCWLVAGLTGEMLTARSVVLNRCVLNGPLRLTEASLTGRLSCRGTQLATHQTNGYALSARGIKVGGDVYLDEGFTAIGAVRLAGADISGQLSCRGAQLTGRDEHGNALSARGIKVGGDVFLSRGFTAADGAVRLAGADIAGMLRCNGARLTGLDNDRNALSARGIKVGGDVFLDGKFTANGAVRLVQANIAGMLRCNDARLAGRDENGNALHGERMRVGGDLLLDKASIKSGAICLLSADITGQFSCGSAELNGCDNDGNALHGDRIKVGGDVFLDGVSANGTVRLVGAQISGQLNCEGATLRNSSGPALHAHGLQVRQGMFLRKGFIAIGAGEEGAVRLTSAHIGGELACDRATLANDSGPGLRAYRLQVDGDVYLTRGFATAASGDRGAVRLTGASIGGNLDCSGAILRNDTGPALLAYGVQIGQDIYLTGEFAATGGGTDDRAAVNLRAARVGGALYFQPKRLEHNVDPHKRLAVDGLTYPGVPGRIRPEDWRELLRYGTPRYTAQPYQQLAAGCRAQGDERQARQTLMAQRDDQLARTNPRWLENTWGKITKVTLGYGYQPWRALVFLAGVVAVSCMLAWLLGAHGALAQTSKTATPGRSCTVIQQVSVGLDLNLPVGISVARTACDLARDSASMTAAWLTAVSWILRLLAWVFAALFIAGFTSAVRKT